MHQVEKTASALDYYASIEENVMNESAIKNAVDMMEHLFEKNNQRQHYGMGIASRV